MASSYDRITRSEEVNELFEQLGQVIHRKVQVLLIGGAVMLELGLKDSTKDIDVVCKNENDKETLLQSTRCLGFELVGPAKRHARLGVNRLAVKGMRNLDVFAGRISYDFELSEPMWQRAIVSRTFGDLVVKDASREDILVMKLIANREGDADDCAALMGAGLNFDVIYEEIEWQYRKSGDLEQKIWITYIEEGIGRLEDEFIMRVPIADKISELADEYREKLYQKLSPSNEVP
jgi:hypothetical protein